MIAALVVVTLVQPVQDWETYMPPCYRYSLKDCQHSDYDVILNYQPRYRSPFYYQWPYKTPLWYGPNYNAPRYWTTPRYVPRRQLRPQYEY